MWSSKKKADTSIQGLPFYIRKDTVFKSRWQVESSLYFISIPGNCYVMHWFFVFSSRCHASSHLSEGVCIRLVREVSSVFPEQFPKERMLKIAAIIEFPIRKCAHFSEYAVLSITINLYFVGLLSHGTIARSKEMEDFFKSRSFLCIVCLQWWTSSVFCAGKKLPVFLMSVWTVQVHFSEHCYSGECILVWANEKDRKFLEWMDVDAFL